MSSCNGVQCNGNFMEPFVEVKLEGDSFSDKMHIIFFAGSCFAELHEKIYYELLHAFFLKILLRIEFTLFIGDIMKISVSYIEVSSCVYLSLQF